MNDTATRADYRAVLHRALHPPVREGRFWVIQTMVLFMAGVHFVLDLHVSIETGAFPSGIPVALLIIPVGYAALRYALAGATATAVWAILLWLPDLLLPHDRGHAGGDLIELALVVVVAIVFGRRIDAERHAHVRVERAMAQSLAVESRYRRLFETNRSAIVVVDRAGTVSDANPAARRLFGDDVIGRSASSLVGGPLGEDRTGDVVVLANGHDYRLNVMTVPTQSGDVETQAIVEDVTEQQSERRRAKRVAQLVVKAEEDQRRRLARELHDEPLQLFLFLARRLDTLGEVEGVPAEVARGLADAHDRSLDAAELLRTVARDLRPPTLDQYGLVAALSSLVVDVDEETGPVARLRVHGTETRLDPEVELGAFRIVQEGMRNAVRHAGARHLDVEVDFNDRELALRVADDGRGFDPQDSSAEPDEHLGLLGMRERAALLGGRLSVLSSPGSGVVVEALLPIETVASAMNDEVP